MLSLALAVVCFAQEPKPPAKPPERPPDPPAAEQPMLPVITTIKHPSPDGFEMTADLYSLPAGNAGPIIVCCHMAGSSRGEFKDIAPEFTRYGLYVLAVDLRCGGEQNGVTNETAAAAEKKLGKKPTFAEAYTDVVEAVKWARELRPNVKVLLLGSSYSASLALVYAGREPTSLDAVLAFSPGEYIEGWSVANEARKIKCTTYLTCGSAPEDKTKAKPISYTIDKKVLRVFFPPETMPAKHGALSLVQTDTAARLREWEPVVAIMLAVTKPEAPGAPKK